MKSITPTHNTPTIVHVPKLPPLNGSSLDFGFNPGKMGDIATIRVNVSLSVKGEGNNRIKICTYDSLYKISGEGLVIEDNIYVCCVQAVHAMKMFLQFDSIGRHIPPELILCPVKEVFEEDLIDMAKALNAVDGKRGFPPPKS